MYLLSHLRGKAHQEAVKDREDCQEDVIIDAPPDKMDAKLAQERERQKALRKRCKKIRSRMALRLGRESTTIISCRDLFKSLQFLTLPSMYILEIFIFYKFKSPDIHTGTDIHECNNKHRQTGACGQDFSKYWP